MKQLHEKYPHYNWHNNKGYGTEEHRKAIEQFGLCKYHRHSFNISPSALKTIDDELTCMPNAEDQTAAAN